MIPVPSRARRAILAATLAALAACSPAGDGPGLAVDGVLGHVRVLSADIGPRPGGSEAAAHAAGYIETTLAALGAHPERHPVGGVDVPAIMLGSMVVRRAHHRDCHEDNLLVRFGPDAGSALVLLAHYDSVADSPGAVDDAVAVGVLLELARELVAHPPATPVWLAFTPDEEVGLVGARRLADELGDRIGFAVALDLVGLDGPLSLNGASEQIGGAELRWLAATADAAGVDLEAPWPHRIVSRWWPEAERADHGAFTMRGIRAIHLYHRGGSSGERIFLAYHTPRDRLDQVSRAGVAEVGRLVRALVTHPPPAPATESGDLGVWLPLPGNLVVPRWAVVVLCGLLLGTAALGLIGIRRRRVSGPGLFAWLAVWIGAGAVAYAVERFAAAGYPAPWVHAPLRHEIAAGLVMAGVAALAAVMIARWRPWAGPHRYAAAAATWNLAIGAALLVIQAAEIAWLWLLPAALLAWVPRLGDRGHRALVVVLVALAIVPTVPLLAPDLLRELYFHGFLPDAVPISALLALHGITAGLAIAHLAAAVRLWGPGATFAVPMLALAAIIIGTLSLVTYQPPCTGGDLHANKLACELAR